MWGSMTACTQALRECARKHLITALFGEPEVRVERTLILRSSIQETRDGSSGREAGKEEKRLWIAYPWSFELREHITSSENIQIKICKRCFVKVKQAK